MRLLRVLGSPSPVKSGDGGGRLRPASPGGKLGHGSVLVPAAPPATRFMVTSWMDRTVWWSESDSAPSTLLPAPSMYRWRTFSCSLLKGRITRLSADLDLCRSVVEAKQEPVYSTLRWTSEMVEWINYKAFIMHTSLQMDVQEIIINISMFI